MVDIRYEIRAFMVNRSTYDIKNAMGWDAVFGRSGYYGLISIRQDPLSVRGKHAFPEGWEKEW